ncbi:phosphoadenylyl-sulfate reductase [Sediminibacillus halophilus]|uniref:Adenosine 5'-phosphosulfate reductase n=1 Tax=Sediminibacillus halophilus TaxID=482461 RepID=A0A1G9P6X4_9BACI|nr:phosphoadenylyl-sulfate reductase [Sediminibacillus halophilus]SDL94464.1 phosphoadenosine phosphosulfate reductase [Sediminibacillus halophilus]
METEKLTFETWEESKRQQLDLQWKDFMDVIKWAYRTYEDRIAYACSFGAEGMVLIDLISKIKPEAKVIFLDTGLHFPETYSLIEKVKKKYPMLELIMAKPAKTLNQQAAELGENLWERNPNLCCHIRKIEPLQQQLQDVDAWISGLRREQSTSRSNVNYVNKDEKFGKIKICPLIHWTWEDVWNYIKLNQLPYNELHDHDYPSIGCAKCTVPVQSDNDFRAGRWTNFSKKECGLHQA